ncbi:MAG: hypothetical protein K0Q90_53 [Paenibacillaceae bacterium]|jgi:hypothetical protein|nr:hypothetical protein [Paenibacillaceae bacterium]
MEERIRIPKVSSTNISAVLAASTDCGMTLYCCVKGELLCLTADELVAADLWENVPDYVRVLRTVLCENGTAVTAYVYYRSEPKAREPAPAGTLAAAPRSKVIAAAKELAAELSAGDGR